MTKLEHQLTADPLHGDQ